MCRKIWRKSRDDLGSYIAIAVLNVMAAAYEWVMNNEIMKWVEERKILGEEQSEFMLYHCLSHPFVH